MYEAWMPAGVHLLSTVSANSALLPGNYFWITQPELAAEKPPFEGAHLTEQQQLVQALVEPAGGLMDGGDDGTASRGQLPQYLHTVHGCC